MGDLSDADEALRTLLQTTQRVFPADHWCVIEAKQRLAVTRLELEDYDTGLVLLEDVFAHYRNRLGETHPLRVHALSNLAIARSSLGDFVGTRAL